MPFGLKNDPQVFQRKMDKIFSDYSSFIIVYIDDMLICSDNEKDHEKHLDVFITLCKEHGIILLEKKVEIKKKEIEFLGMIIDSKGIKLQSHCDAPKPGGPLTTRQPAEHKWTSGYPTPLQKIG